MKMPIKTQILATVGLALSCGAAPIEVRVSDAQAEVSLAFESELPSAPVVRTTLVGEPGARNTPENPFACVSAEDSLPFAGGKTCVVELKPYSFIVLRFKTK